MGGLSFEQSCLRGCLGLKPGKGLASADHPVARMRSRDLSRRGLEEPLLQGEKRREGLAAWQDGWQQPLELVIRMRGRPRGPTARISNDRGTALAESQ